MRLIGCNVIVRVQSVIVCRSLVLKVAKDSGQGVYHYTPGSRHYTPMTLTHFISSFQLHLHLHCNCFELPFGDKKTAYLTSAPDS